jgi:nitrite reductase (cytochrome c-552)
MSNAAQNSSRASRWPYVVAIFGSAAVTLGLAALLLNIRERKKEGEQHYFSLSGIDENISDPEVWGRNFPRQYDGYLRTVDNERTQHGGSESLPPSKLDADPRLKRIFAGYAFSIDYREKRGHAFMLEDQEKTERIAKVKQPGACLHCHSSVLPLFRFAGNGDVMKGFENVCAMPYQQAHNMTGADGKKLITHPVACIDCHDPKTMQLRITRPGFILGIQSLANSTASLPHLTSIVQWRLDRDAKRPKAGDHYDVNTMATRQEMRSFVCGQCHVEYYFKGEGKLLTYPWHNGLTVDEIERYYDDLKYRDFVHRETNAPVLKAQHPEFEMWNQGVHARSGVACADCHMPYKREGAVKISDHQVRSPMLDMTRACLVCHRFSETEMRSRVDLIQGRTKQLSDRAEAALLELYDAVKAAKEAGATEEHLQDSYKLQRRAQWRIDFILSENSRGFHAPQETARVLGEAIDFARQGEIAAMKAKRK